MTVKMRGVTPKGMDLIRGVDAPPEASDTTFGQRFSAMLRTESDIAMMADQMAYFTDNGPAEENYNPYASGLIPPDLDQYWQEFHGDHNPRQTRLTVARLRHLQEQRRIREQASGFESLLGYGVGGLATSTTIPFLLMPAGRLFAAGKATQGGMSIGKTIGEVAAIGAAEETLAEVMRHSLDPLRTMGESYASVASVSLFAGALGGLGAKMTNTKYANAVKEVEELNDAAKEEGGLKKWMEGEGGDASAAKTLDAEDAPEELGWVAKVGGQIFPGVRLLTSPAKKVRVAVDKLINHAFGSKRSSAENNIRRTEMVARSRTRIILNDNYQKAVNEGYDQKIDVFYEDIGRALINKDQGGGKHVDAAAKQLREEIIDPIKVRFQQLGDLPEIFETKFADSYFPRLYREEVTRESIKYTNILKDHLLEKNTDLTEVEALELAKDYMDKIKGWDVSRLPEGVVGSTGRLKERGIALRDSELQDLGFLEKNPLIVLDKYINSVVPEMEIKFAFGGVERALELKQKKLNYEQNVAEIKERYEELMKDPAKMRDLEKQGIKDDYEDFIEMETRRYKSEQEGIERVYAGRMEDAQIEYERFTKDIRNRYKPMFQELQEKYNLQLTRRRDKRDKTIAGHKKDFDDAEKMLRENYEPLQPKKNARVQKKLEQEIRRARTVRDDAITKTKNAATRDIKKIDKTYEEAKTEVQTRLDEELQPHKDRYADKKNQAGIDKRAGERASRTLHENNKDSLRNAREQEKKQAQKEKEGSEKQLRHQKRMTLKQQKQALKKAEKEEGGAAHLLQDTVAAIKEEYRQLIGQAKNQKAADKLEKRMNADLDDLFAMRDRLLGIYKRPASDEKFFSNMGQGLRTWAYLAYMGFITVASIPDMARAIMKHGVNSAWAGMRGGFMPFFKGLDAGSAIQRQAMGDMGIAVDALLSSRALMMGDVGDLTGRYALATKLFTKYTLMNRWNDAMKHVAAIAAQDRFLKQIMKYDSLSIGRKQELAEYGFDKEMVDRIRTESHNFNNIKGAVMANTNKWNDKPAALHFEKMLLRDTEMSIVTPGVGDSPLFMSKEMSKLIFQFKSFFFASHVRSFLPMLRQMSRGDANAFIGALIQISLGAFVVEPLRMAAGGKSDEMNELNWQDWAYAGMDRSGIAALPMEFFNLTDKVAQGTISEFMGMRHSRYNQRGMQVSSGPGIGLAEDFAMMPISMASGAIEGEWRESTTSSLRHMIPAQNLIYTRWLFNVAEDWLNNATNAQ